MIERISWSVLVVAVALAAVATTPASACTRCMRAFADVASMI